MGANISNLLSNKIEEFIDEGEELASRCEDLTRESGDDELDFSLTVGVGTEYSELIQSYERWYTATRVIVEEYAPERIADFDECYSDFRTAINIDEANYSDHAPQVFRYLSNPIITQMGLLESLPLRIELERFRIRNEISSRISSEELQQARRYFEDGELRIPGVLAGIALERHLNTLCENVDQDLEFGYMDGISSLANTLNQAEIISDDERRLLDYLSGLRNKCAHANEEEPEESEIRRFLEEAEQFIRSH